MRSSKYLNCQKLLIPNLPHRSASVFLHNVHKSFSYTTNIWSAARWNLCVFILGTAGLIMVVENFIFRGNTQYWNGTCCTCSGRIPLNVSERISITFRRNRQTKKYVNNTFKKSCYRVRSSIQIFIIKDFLPDALTVDSWAVETNQGGWDHNICYKWMLWESSVIQSVLFLYKHMYFWLLAFI